MRALIIFSAIFIFLASSTPSFSGGDKLRRPGRDGYLKRDSLDEDRINIYDRGGSSKGYLKGDNIFKDRMYIYDKNGRKKGYIKKDTLFDDRTNIYDSNGRRKGYLKDD